jgi:hypothetical protein
MEQDRRPSGTAQWRASDIASTNARAGGAPGPAAEPLGERAKEKAEHTSIFQPIVAVSDDGTVTIEWSESYVQTLDQGGKFVADNRSDHGEALDHILGSPDLPGWTRLRRLADHMEAQATAHMPARQSTHPPVGRGGGADGVGL